VKQYTPKRKVLKQKMEHELLVSQAEYRECRAALAAARTTLVQARRHYKRDRTHFREVILSAAQRLQISSTEIKQLEDEKAAQLAVLSGDLLNLQGSMVRERGRVQTLLRDKDATIVSQQAEIDALRRQNAALEAQTAAIFNSVKSAELAGMPGELPGYRREDDKSSPKPPIPSRAGVNKKLQLGGAPPPPPPRGVSLKDKRSKNEQCDSESEKKFSSDKIENNFDSGRESDETFDNESVKSESTDLSVSPSLFNPKSSQSPQSSHAKSRDLEEKVVKMDKKTKVTFWTDTYL